MIEVEKKDWKNEGRVEYFIKGTHILHREDGPAIELSDGRREWFINGTLHRVDGPAVIYWHGFKEWYLNGRYFSTKERWFDALSEDQKAKALYSEYFIKG